MEENSPHGHDRRYFIVHFTGTNSDDETQRGKIHMFVEKYGYVNEKYIKKTIEEDFKLRSPYVERVEELDEADFYDFISEEMHPANKARFDQSRKKKDDLDGLI